MNVEVKKKPAKEDRYSEILKQKAKSSFSLFWEKYPNGYAGGCEVINRRAVLR